MNGGIQNSVTVTRLWENKDSAVSKFLPFGLLKSDVFQFIVQGANKE